MAKHINKHGKSTAEDTEFEHYNITLRSVQILILLLESEETDVIFQTLRAITDYAGKEIENRYVLFNLNAIKYIMPHIDHIEVNIRRFALKALSYLCKLSRGPEQVLEDPENLRKIAQILVKVEDIMILEFASLVLAELTREPIGRDQIMSLDVLGSLFSRMKNSPDPDVQKNCLQVVANLLNDPNWTSKVTSSPHFNWQSLTTLMQSKYIAIQNETLKVVDKLICRYEDHDLQKSFKYAHGTEYLCKILESYEWRDVHPQVLGVLRHYVELDENAAHLHKMACIEKILEYLDIVPPLNKPYYLAVLTQMSFNVSGRVALYETGVDLVFCEELVSDSALVADAALGVANMTQLLASAIRMCNTNIIEALCGILEDEEMEWFDVRINVLQALAGLCRIIPKAACNLVEPKTFVALRNININYVNNPLEAQRLALQVYINLQNYYVSAKAMLNEEFMQELLNILQRIDMNLKITTCTVITALMVYDIAKDLFTSRKGEEVVSKNLRIEHVGLRTALCKLISSSVTEEGSNVYLELGTIHYMVENRRAGYAVSTWDAALKTIFRHNASAKLAYTGRLDINDMTSEGFYCPKRLDERFPTLHEILTTPTLWQNPVFVCFFNQPDWDSASEIDNRNSGNRTMSESNMILCSPSRRFHPDIDDINLRTHLLKLKMWFGETASFHYRELASGNFEVRYREKCYEVSISLKYKAQILAEYVVEQMGGLSQKDCSLPSVDLHLANIMVQLNSSIIGLGWIKCGGSLERALLYKVLADRIGLPCALHRATSAYAWCEIAVPEADAEDDKDPTQNYPAGLLRPNYVVDLTVNPGRLIPRDSREARLTCGPKCAPPYTAGTRHEDCSCENIEHTGVKNECRYLADWG